MQRAVQALTKRALPGTAGRVAERAIGAKIALASLPFLLMAVLVIAPIIAIIGASAEAKSSGCGTTESSEASTGNGPPVGLEGPPKNLIPIYQEASTTVGLNPEGPAILAAINRVETNFGENQGPSSAGAIGWMQFMPATWTEYGEGGDPSDPHDAIFAAARLLKANGAPDNWHDAIFGYNHAEWYVEEVQDYAHQYSKDVPADPSKKSKDGGGNGSKNGGNGGSKDGGKGGSEGKSTSEAEGSEASFCVEDAASTETVAGPKAKLLPNGEAAAPSSAPEAVKKMVAAGNEIAGLPYVWGGHHAPGAPTSGYDCSSAVAYVLYGAGLMPPGSAGYTHEEFYMSHVAAEFVAGGPIDVLEPGPGKWVSVFSSSEHVEMSIAGVMFNDSSSGLRNGKGPHGTNLSMWQPLKSLPAEFAVSHPAGL